MNWKNRIWKRMLIGGTVFLLVSTRSSVYAAEKDGVAVELPVHQTVCEETPERIFEYELTALEEDSPMPDESENGRYHFSMNGTESRKMGQ